jgi:hypothetical protein
MPVIFATVSAMTSSSTVPPPSGSSSRHSFWIVLALLAQLIGLVAELRGALEVLVGDRLFLLLVELRDVACRAPGGPAAGHRAEAHAAPASSITSIALSGRKRR